MINIDKLLNKGVSKHNETIDKGNGIYEDIKYWSKKFISFIETSKTSRHTLRSYRFILNTLKDFCIELKDTECKNINLSDFNAILINEFLTYLENYSINIEYGTLRRRLEILFRYSEELAKTKSVRDFLLLPELLSDRYEINEIEIFEYMIKDFAKFMKSKNILPNEINNNYIENYVVNIPKLSNKTMLQRKAALQSFLTYIDNSVKEEHFKSYYWELKKYPLPKQNAKVVKCAFDEELLDKILFVLHDCPIHTSKYNGTVYKNSEYAAYKNTFLILVMLYGGARAAEAIQVKFNDVELIKTGTGVSMYKITVLGKGNKERPLYIKEEYLKNHFEYLLNNRGNNKYISGIPKSSTPLTTQRLYQFSKKIFELAGSQKRGLHIFRHHFASNFVEKNGNIKMLQELLDHASVSTTMIYSDVREKIKIDALSAI